MGTDEDIGARTARNRGECFVIERFFGDLKDADFDVRILRFEVSNDGFERRFFATLLGVPQIEHDILSRNFERK